MPPPHLNPNRFSRLRSQAAASLTLQTGLNSAPLPHTHFLRLEVTNLTSELKYSFLGKVIFNNTLILIKVAMEVI